MDFSFKGVFGVSGVVGNTKTAFYKIVILSSILLCLFWSSVFLYGTFYYFYIPPVSHVFPVHLEFDTLCGSDSCRYPSANVSLLYRGQPQLLTRGQTYKIYLDLEMPESPVNRVTAGMFMVKLVLYARHGSAIQSSYRSAVLHYKSLPVRLLHSVVFSPFMLFGSREEKQQIEVLLFDAYVEDYIKRTAGANIEIHSNSIEIYSTFLRIEAHLTGLRYLMFQWPITSAVFGIATNFVFLSFVTLCSWLKYVFSKSSNEDFNLETEYNLTPVIHRKSKSPEKAASQSLSSSALTHMGSSASQRWYLEHVIGKGTLGRLRQHWEAVLPEVNSTSGSGTFPIESVSNSAGASGGNQETHQHRTEEISETSEQAEQAKERSDPEEEGGEIFENAFEMLSYSPSPRRRQISPAES